MVYSRVIPDQREWLWYRYCLLIVVGAGTMAAQAMTTSAILARKRV